MVRFLLFGSHHVGCNQRRYGQICTKGFLCGFTGADMNDVTIRNAMDQAAAAAEGCQEFKRETYAIVLLATLMGAVPTAARHGAASSVVSSASAAVGKPYSAAEYFSRSDTYTEVEKVVVAGSFLEKHQALADYTIEDIRGCLTSAKVSLPANLSLAIFKGAKKGLLMEVPGGRGGKKVWALTQTGERWISEVIHVDKK
jgi:hypothetical protein